jgi:hypothetical protein
MLGFKICIPFLMKGNSLLNDISKNKGGQMPEHSRGEGEQHILPKGTPKTLAFNLKVHN